MKITSRQKQVCDYQTFSNPYLGLATMILYQAGYDLKACGNAEETMVMGERVRKSDVKRFLNTKWALWLAVNCGIDEVTFLNYRRRLQSEL